MEAVSVMPDSCPATLKLPVKFMVPVVEGASSFHLKAAVLWGGRRLTLGGMGPSTKVGLTPVHVRVGSTL